MRLGVALPNHLPWGLQGRELLDWARLAERLGFASLATLDRPNYDGWDPLITLAAVAAVTERARLVTAILQLPNRNPVLVAKQAAVIDRISGGRLQLGLGVGSRPDDYDIFGAEFAGRGGRFSTGVRQIRDTWAAGDAADAYHGALGPAPLQRPFPFIWIGATTERTMARAIEIGDGLMLSGTRSMLEGLSGLVREIRERATAADKPNFAVSRILYIAIESGSAVAAAAIANLERFYACWAWAPATDMIYIGSITTIREIIQAHDAAGLDELILIPEVADPQQLVLLAEATGLQA